MPVRDIRATIGVDGEKEFTAALNDAVRSMKLMDGEMKKVSAAYELSGDQTEYLAQKSRLLDSEMRQQERIVDALTGALSDAEKKYEGNTYKIDQYRTKLNAAETTMLKLRKASADADKELEELGRDSERTGRRLEQGIGEAADDVSRKFDSMVNKLDSDIGSIKSMTSISAVVGVAGTIGGAVKSAYDGMKGLVDETAEYNRSMAFLKTNADQAGISFQTVKKMALDVSGITGDMGASIEGLSNLLQIGLDPSELERTVNLLSGISIQIPETMKFENLAESLLETISTGEATGQYAEYIDKLTKETGTTLDTVNKALKNAKKVGSDAVVTSALSFLEEGGALDRLEQYRAEYSELVNYFEAQAKLTDSMANLGKTMTPAATAGIEFVSDLVDKMTTMIVAAGEAAEKQNEKTKTLQEQQKQFEKTLESETNLYSKIEETENKIKEAAEAGDTLEIERLNADRQLYIEQLNQTAQDFGEAGENLRSELWDPDITTDGSEAKEAGKTDAEDYNDGVKEYFESTPIYIPSWDDINPGIETGAYDTGKDIALNIGDGIEDYAYYAIGKTSAMMARIHSAMNRKITYPSIGLPSTTSSTAYASAGTGKTTLSIDGKKLGEATVAYNNAALGQSLIRAETYG